MTNTLKLILTGALLGLLAACGGGSDSQEADGGAEGEAVRESEPIAPGDTVPPTGVPPLAEDGEDADSSSVDSANGGDSGPGSIDTSTPEAAMDSFMSLLADAELERATEVCVQGAPGTQAITKTAEGWRKAEADGLDISSLKPKLVGHIPNLYWEKIGEEEGVATFRVTGPDRDPFEMTVEMTGDEWLVVPPETGLP